MADPVPSECKDVFDKLLHAAIEEAQEGLAEGGIPIGSALGNTQGEILGRGHNMRVQQGDPMAHAEISCMRRAGRRPHFRGLILAPTLMP
ncbi:MAG: nucleoside deaminase, partial [Planctomycetes bacterium]|nr:nucleoside deaminase [Planctomycetota bacterium]